MPTSLAAAPITLGSGPDTILLNVSEDAYLGDAQFTVGVDGVQIGGVQTAVVSHALREQQTFVIQGDFGAGPHALSVDFLNDAYAGTPQSDRNLYVDSVQSGGQTYAAELALYSAGTQTVTVQTPPRPVTIGAGPDAIGLHIAEDAYQGDAQFTVSVDGVQIGGVQTATALHSSGQDQLFTVLGDFGIVPHTLTVNFLNDAYGGTPDTDRNLYVDRIDRGGFSSGNNAVLYSGGPVTFSLSSIPAPTGPVTIGAGPDAIGLHISEDAHQGDAQFTVSVDGVQVGDVQTATASHASVATQAFTVQGSFGAGPHTVSVDLLNGRSTPGTNRNLYVDSITYAGLTTATRAALSSSGSQSFTVQPPAAVITGSDVTGPTSGYAVLNGTSGDDTIVAHGQGNTINGLGGNDAILASEGGGDTITVGSPKDGLSALHDQVTVAGAGNTVTAGDEAVTLSGAASATVATLGNGANTVQLDGPGNTIAVGDGANTLATTGGGATVNISGFLLSGNYSDAVTITGDHNTVSAQVDQGKYPAAGNVTIDGGTGDGNFALGWGQGSVHTGGLHNTISFGFGTFDIIAGSGYDTVTASGFPGNPKGAIQLAGQHNTIETSGAVLTVAGGAGYGTFDRSGDPATGNGGPSSITTGGEFNAVTLRGGNTTVDPGSGNDTVSLFGGNSSLVFHGAGNMLFIHPGPAGNSNGGPATSTVNDQSADLQIFVDPGLQSLTLSQFGPAGVVHLLGGAGGYATPDQALAALTPDGTGGYTLPVNTGAIHFGAVPHLQSSNFAIG